MVINYGQAKQQLASVVKNGLCPDDPEVGQYINEACARLVDSGKWKGMIRPVAICHRAGLFTLPWDVDTILAASDCGVPVSVNNQFYEFLPGGPFKMSECNPWREIAERGENYCTAFDITGAMKIRVYNDLAQDNGKAILFQGINDDKNWVQTVDGGDVVDGEPIIFNNATPPVTTTTWTKLEAVQKELTQGYIRIYQVDPDTNENMGLLSVYHPNEENISYRRYFYGNFCRNRCNDGEEKYHPLQFLCKVRFTPLVRDTDLVPITAPGALKNMVQALWPERNGQLDVAQAFEQRAINYLQNELKQSQGSNQYVKSIIPGCGYGPAARSFR